MTQPSTKNNAKEMAQSVMPTVDLSAFLSGTESEQDTIARQVDETCQLSGFLIIKNHGIADGTIDDAWNSAAHFFKFPLNKKLGARSGDPRCPRGYFPPQSETLAQSRGVATPPDQKEAFSIGPLIAPQLACDAADYYFHYGQNIWPAEPAGFRDNWIRYYQAMEKLGAQ
jgi:isopenicillin N synthase-like dioxygenase